MLDDIVYSLIQLFYFILVLFIGGLSLIFLFMFPLQMISLMLFVLLIRIII
jgi:hypothetical protein